MLGNKLIFITSALSRRLVALGKQMQRSGIDVYFAAPMGDSVQWITDGRYIRLGKLGSRLFGAGRIKNFDSTAVCFDNAAAQLADRAKLKKICFFDEIGIDLSVWSPKAVSGNLQTMLLSSYNVPPQSKMILVLDPSEKDIKRLILANQGLDHSDFILALHGKINKCIARKINRRLKTTPNIVYLGSEPDLPSLMRASFAIISLSAGNNFYKVAAMAMGRTAAFPSGGAIKPNIATDGDLETVLKRILSLPLKTREEFEAKNIRFAAAHSLEKNIIKLKSMIK